ncbi:hypothetical protein L7F22_049639 [Adiantum nelumboides]|nr:hypothetical protein [Adiantum nelumboides]
MPNLDDGLFFPILSSPSFSASFNVFDNYVFSLGFYISCSKSDGADDQTAGCSLYLAVCAGSRLSSNEESFTYHLDLNYGSSRPYGYPGYGRGLAIPVWIANLHRPIKNALNASLEVIVKDDVAPFHDSGSGQPLSLQLRSGDEVLWSVSNVGMMEVQDSGYFLVYTSTGLQRTVAFQQSPFTDILVEGQELKVGMELTSNDSAFSARMEKGGLILFQNDLGIEPPAPYWIFPLLRDSADSHSFDKPTMNQLVASAPCSGDDMSSHSSAYVQVRRKQPHRMLLALEPGSCPAGSLQPSVQTGLQDLHWEVNISWSFLRLETDGRLYLYAVSDSSDVIARDALSSEKVRHTWGLATIAWWTMIVPSTVLHT